MCYRTLVRPVLEYSSVVWDPHFETDREKIEAIQKRGARFVTGNYKYETGNTRLNMQKLGWDPLEERRAKAKVGMLYKARNDLIEIPKSDLYVNTRGNRNNNLNYLLPTSNVDCHLHSFFPSSIRLWNVLPAEIQNSSDVEEFKKELNKITLKKSYF